MPYTNVWNEGFPPDTQQANLLGQDIRSAKLDLRERLSSFGAGLLANRPTPEASFAGVTYFATDTGRLYQWTGTAWTDITSNFFSPKTLFRSSGIVSHTNASANPQSYFSYTVPANTLGPASWLEIEFNVNFYNQQASVNSYANLYVGAILVNQFLTKATGSIRHILKLINNNVINQQWPWAEVLSSNSGIASGVVPMGSLAIDFSQDQTVVLQLGSGVPATDAQSSNYLIVKLYG